MSNSLSAFLRLAFLAGFGLVHSLTGQAASPDTGTIVIHCRPLAARVEIPGLTFDNAATKSLWRLENIPAGTYTASISALKKQLQHSFSVAAGGTAEFTVNLLEGRVTEGPPAVVSAAPAPPVLEAARPAPAKVPALLSGPRYTIPELNLTMLAVAPGAFDMGTATGGPQSGRPLTPVILSDQFWLGRTEVTQAQWEMVMGQNNSLCRGPSLPVENITWAQAVQFCQKVTEHERAAGRITEGYAYFLPTEAQWEYACRAGSTDYSPERLDAAAWYSVNGEKRTHPVATKEPNAWGFCDLQGNVAEWCYDWYAEYPPGPVRDPVGAQGGQARVVRGGSWAQNGVACRPTERGGENPQQARPYVGFRIVLVSIRPVRR